MSALVEAVAEWMVSELNAHRELHQDEAADQIVHRFGREFTYDNENGNPAIRADVLKAFRKLTDENVVWERGRRVWRFRERGDEPGRMQP